MTGAAQALPDRVRAAAAAIADARAGRRGAPPIDNVLDLLPDELLAEVVADARAALDAADAVIRPRADHLLRAADADWLRVATDAGTLLVLARDDRGRCCAALSLRGSGSRAYGHAEGAAAVWEILRRHLSIHLPDLAAGGPAPPTAAPAPNPAESAP